MTSAKVLVLNATGKVGRNVCVALKEAGFDVFGTTRSPQSTLQKNGISPVVCNYTVRADLDRAFAQSGAKKAFVITDYFGAAKSKMATEVQQGKNAIDAAKAAGIDHLIFMSVADAEFFDDHVSHLKAKVVLEDYLRHSGVRYSILRPCAFFENLDDPNNWNPLKKGTVKFMSPGGYFDFLHPWPGQTPPPNLIAMGWTSEATAGFVGVLRGFLGVDKAAGGFLEPIAASAELDGYRAVQEPI